MIKLMDLLKESFLKEGGKGSGPNRGDRKGMDYKDYAGKKVTGKSNPEGKKWGMKSHTHDSNIFTAKDAKKLGIKTGEVEKLKQLMEKFNMPLKIKEVI